MTQKDEFRVNGPAKVFLLYKLLLVSKKYEEII